MFNLGYSHSTAARLPGAEIAIILTASAVLTLPLFGLVGRLDELLVRSLFIR